MFVDVANDNVYLTHCTQRAHLIAACGCGQSLFDILHMMCTLLTDVCGCGQSLFDILHMMCTLLTDVC